MQMPRTEAQVRCRSFARVVNAAPFSLLRFCMNTCRGEPSIPVCWLSVHGELRPLQLPLPPLLLPVAGWLLLLMLEPVEVCMHAASVHRGMNRGMGAEYE